MGPLPAFMLDGTEDVVSVEAPTGDKVWLVRDYALGRQVLTDSRFSRSEAVKARAPKFIPVQPVPESMMSRDGSEHARLRRVVMGAFSASRIAALAPTVERQANEHIDRLLAMGPPADLIEGLALPLSLGVLCSLLGVPPQDGDHFCHLVEELFDITDGSVREKTERRIKLVAYMTGLIARKRQQPDDDLLTRMVQAHDRGDLSLSELITMGLTLLMAGYETTAAQIGLSALAVLSDPNEYERLRRRPASLPAAVDELLRLTPAAPVSFARVAREAVELNGVTVAAGEAVVVSVLHGNRDKVAFTGSENHAGERRPVPHLTFGHGVHRCPGASLATLQVRIALDLLLRRFANLRLAAGPAEPVVWKEGLLTRGLSRLLVEWDAPQ
ncbi:cytochrome P450 [Streptomyces sp. YS-3]|uniref:cytochrome P450 n=1 Tax=Streptomyces sp. YS-3 TaxID=3381352 RepID=UPI00386A9771